VIREFARSQNKIKKTSSLEFTSLKINYNLPEADEGRTLKYKKKLSLQSA